MCMEKRHFYTSFIIFWRKLVSFFDLGWGVDSVVFFTELGVWELDHRWKVCAFILAGAADTGYSGEIGRAHV